MKIALREVAMGRQIVELSQQEVIRLEFILMDGNEKEAVLSAISSYIEHCCSF